MAGRPSDKHEKVYEYLVKFTKENGYPPSVREIADAVGLQSPSTVYFHLKNLDKEGRVILNRGKSRCTLLPKEALEGREDMVPVVGSVAAGAPILAEEQIEDYLPYDVGGAKGEHFALRVRGESMLGAGILPGDLVVVHQQENFVNGDIVVALFEDEATVKTYQKKKGHVWLLPENPAYQPIDGEGAALLGRVVAVIRKY